MSTRAKPPGSQREPAVPQDDGFREFAESIVQHIDEVFFWRDPDSLKPYFVSHAYERIWGQSCLSAYADPSSWIESIHPEDRDRVIEEFERAATSSQAQIEYRIVRPDGDVRWIWARTFSVPTETGSSDATDRDRAGHHRTQASGKDAGVPGVHRRILGR